MLVSVVVPLGMSVAVGVKADVVPAVDAVLVGVVFSLLDREVVIDGTEVTLVTTTALGALVALFVVEGVRGMHWYAPTPTKPPAADF